MGVDSMTAMTGDVGMSGGEGASVTTTAPSPVVQAASSEASLSTPSQDAVTQAKTSAPVDANPASNGENTDQSGQTDKGNTAPTTEPTAYGAEAYAFAMPAAVAQDPALVSRIQDFCVHSQLSPQQAQAAMNFWQAEQNAAMEQGLKHCEQNLKDRWQGAYDHKLEQARSTLKMLDNRMEGRLMPLMQGPLGNSPVFAEMLEKLSDVVGETTMEAGGMGGTRGSFAGSQRMSTEDFLRQVVFK